MYIVLISIHGLIRAHDLELGRDPDTGGQTKYLVDLARSLGKHPEVGQVDLATRRIHDPTVSEEYAEPLEALNGKARIVRIEAGPPEYLRKEDLWDHLDSFMDNLLIWLNEQSRMPDVIHAHYADGGYVGVRLSNLLGVPLVFTGHSLGRDKLQQLLAKGMSREKVEALYNIDRRIDAEEETLANADLVITSTRNEIDEQYELYDYYRPDRMAVVPPGTDLQKFHPSRDEGQAGSLEKRVAVFLRKPEKPLILALSRADERKNILTLLEAYGESRELQKAANLLIVAGNRDDIREMDRGPQSVLTDILLWIDYYDLYGKVALPKHHRPEEVPGIYRLAAASNGVFINPALTEPFGLTLLEAAATGLPVVATENGGPVDIIGNCRNGLLVDPLDKEAIARALLDVLGDARRWREYARSGIEGVRRYYSWDAHVETYMRKVRNLPKGYEQIPSTPPQRQSSRYRDRAVFTDIDQNLLGNPAGLKRFINVVRKNRKCATFGIATGRRLDSALSVLKKYGVPTPDVLITSLGTAIHYGKSLTADDFWLEHIDHLWKPRAVRRLLEDLPGLSPQPKAEQSRFKLAYHYDPAVAPPVEEINSILLKHELTANVIHAFGQYLDIVP
ncbi:MAG: HAD family hydrolase, partial [Pseudomonadota bacterium]